METIKDRARNFANNCVFDDEVMYISAVVNKVEYTIRVYPGSPLGKEIEPHIREEIAIRVIEDGTIR